MPVVNPSSCVGAQTLVYLSPCRDNFQDKGNFYRHATSRVSMQFQPLNQRNVLRWKAIGTGSVHASSSSFISTSKRSVFVCNAALNARCSQGQTQTVTRQTPTITQAPSQGKERSPKLDDGGSGFPPRDDGGGGGGGGGGGNSSGGFFLFGFLLFMGYLKDLEGEHDNNH